MSEADANPAVPEPDPAPGSAEHPLRPGKRPIPLTIFCCLGFISFPMYISQFFMPVQRMEQIAINGDAHFQWFFLLVLTTVLGYIGLWMMRRWGLYLFTIAAFAMTLHLVVGTRNMQVFREQLVAEAAGNPLADPPVDTTFLDHEEYLAYWERAGVEDRRSSLIEAKPRTFWIRAGLESAKSFFVCFIGFLVRKRML